MSTPAWIGYAAVAAVLSGVVARMIYVSRGPAPDEASIASGLRYCPACKRDTLRHPTKGCTVCRSLDSIF